VVDNKNLVNDLQRMEQASFLPKQRVSINKGDEQSKTVTIEIEKHLIDRLEPILRFWQVSKQSFFYAIWSLLLEKYTDRDEILFAASDNLSAYFPVFVRIQPNISFAKHVQRIEQMMANKEQLIFYCQNITFDHLVTIVTQPSNERSVDSLRMENLSMKITAQWYERLVIHVCYDPALYDVPFVQQIGNHLQHIFQQLSEDQQLALSAIDMITEHEKKQILHLFQPASTAFEPVRLEDLFVQQVQKTPDHLAVISDSGMLTYTQLDEQSTRLAAFLQQKGIGRGHIVGLMVGQTPWMLVGILGVLKAGAAFLPIDVSYPTERIRYMVKDSGASMLLREATIPLIDAFQNMTWNIEDTIHERLVLSNVHKQVDDLVYVIYTSGSTGRPKGVMVEHFALCNLVTWHNHYYQVTAADRSTKYAGFGFDASVWEIFPYLVAGATICMVPSEIRYDIDALHNYFVEQEVTISFLPTPVAEQFMERKNEKLTLRTLLVGGDALHRVYHQPYRIVNNYGPTENTVVTTCAEVHAKDPFYPIGRPIANNQVLILDRKGRLQPIGVPGELCISGASLARGYFNQPELTSAKFVNHPYASDQRLYKSGDLARWLADGTIEYIGRVDQQVKIRGYRIELAEIEQCLLQHPHVQAVVVTAIMDEDGDPSLAAYVVADADICRLNAYARKMLPAYMVPTYWKKLAMLPLTPNGKVDKKALPSPKPFAAPKASEAPMTAVERQLSELWANVLHIDAAGLTDHFFQLGGHSLKAAKLVAQVRRRFGVEMPVSAVFTYPTLQAMANYLQHAQTETIDELLPLSKREYYPVSSVQKRMIAVEQAGEIGTTYHTPAVWEIRGELDVERFKRAIQAVVERHESFRTSFHYIEGEIQQKVHRNVMWQLEQITLPNEQAAQNWVNQFIRPFSFNRAPLFRVGLVTISETHYFFVLDIHHSICDGITMEIIQRELSACYQQKQLPEQRYQYKDFAVLEMSSREQARWKIAESYYQSLFAEDIPVLDLPTDFPRPAQQQFSGATKTVFLPKKVTERCMQMALESGSTLYMQLLAVYLILLARYSGQQSLIVGSIVAGRNRVEWENVCGMFVNTVPIRAEYDKTLTFSQWLQLVKSQVLAAQDHGRYPFGELLDALHINRDLARNPLFDTVFVMQNTVHHAWDIPNLQITEKIVDRKHAMFDMTWEATETDAGIKLSVEYNTALFRSETIERMIQHFVHLLEQVQQHPELPLSQLVLVTEVEKKQLLSLSTGNECVLPEGKTVVHLFQAQVKKTPNAIAVYGKGKQLTYAQLDEQSTQLAGILQRRGVTVEKIVAICMEASVELFVSIWAVLKAGGAYLPIDPTYPADRIAYMLANSRTTLLLTDGRSTIPASYNGEVINSCDQWWKQQGTTSLDKYASPNDLAYVIYTSGSTGRPKGVMVEHRALLNLVLWHNEYYQVSADDRSTKFAGLGFDASVWEIFPYLVKGSTIYIVDEDARKDVYLLHQFFSKHNITISFLPTQLAEQFIETKNQTLRRLLVGGDQLHKVKEQPYQIINNYGPTENTVVATCCHVTAGQECLPIGRPIANNCVYVLNEDHQLQPIGVPGELYISGKSLARGYLYQTEWTEKAFVPHPFVPGERIYKTGDLARWLPSGELEYLGRIDQQVKIRGFRVELGEIQHHLLKHENIAEAFVVARRDETGGQVLCAYVVSDKELDVSQLKKQLAKSLPNYMIPTFFVKLQYFPLTANGKVDVRALPEPAKGERPTYIAPKLPTEQLLADIWAEVLQVKRVGRNDNFFALGGDSIKGIQIAARLHQHHWLLKVNDLLQNPTIAELAPLLQKQDQSSDQSVITGEVPLSPIQQWFFAQDIPNVNHWNQAVMLCQQEAWDETAVNQALQQMVVHHDVLRMRYYIDEEIKQYNEGVDGKYFSLQCFSFGEGTETEIERQMTTEANRLQQRMSITNGPLVQAAIFATTTKHYLLLIVHHLVIDGVSWRILLEDLMHCYRAICQQRNIQLPAKTHSFQSWAKALYHYANSPSLANDLAYWYQVEQEQVPMLKKDDRNITDYRLGDCDYLELVFSPIETTNILGPAHQAYHTEVNDLLLAALVQAIGEWSAVDKVAIHLEGHGREDIIEGIDISRTVGWFTTMFPVVFSSVATNKAEMIQQVKETLRKIPQRGISYGLLKYLRSSDQQPFLFQLEPEISFNYLGRFEQTIQMSGIGDKSYLLGDCFSSETPVHPLEIYGIVIDGRLHIRFQYHSKAYRKETIDNLVRCYQQALLTLVDHCLEQEEVTWTPSDFSASELDADELSEFLESLE
jgi:bacitracin synthase 3